MAEISIVLRGITESQVKRTEVSLNVNDGSLMTRFFASATPQFILKLDTQDREPRTLRVQAWAYGPREIIGHGALSTHFSSDACNFFTVAMRPVATDGGGDGGPDVGLDGPGLDQLPEFDMAGPDLPVAPSGWVQIKAGTFSMGSPETVPGGDLGSVANPCHKDNEQQHQVTLTRGFLIQQTEVTQGDFAKQMGYNPSKNSGCGQCPVENLTWHEAAAYCNALSKSVGTPCYVCTLPPKGAPKDVVCAPAAAFKGKALYDCTGYRLPTEAEWEYAYRGGSTTDFHNGPVNLTNCPGFYGNCADLSCTNADLIGWNKNNSLGKTHPVKLKQPNAHGLYDMAGNVLEFVNDWYEGKMVSTHVTDPVGPASSSVSERGLRGGSFLDAAEWSRAAFRFSVNQSVRNRAAGFRCVRTLVKPTHDAGADSIGGQ